MEVWVVEVVDQRGYGTKRFIVCEDEAEAVATIRDLRKKGRDGQRWELCDGQKAPPRS